MAKEPAAAAKVEKKPAAKAEKKPAAKAEKNPAPNVAGFRAHAVTHPAPPDSHLLHV